MALRKNPEYMPANNDRYNDDNRGFWQAFGDAVGEGLFKGNGQYDIRVVHQHEAKGF